MDFAFTESQQEVTQVARKFFARLTPEAGGTGTQLAKIGALLAQR